VSASTTSHRLVSIQCPRGHHVASVVATPDGVVVTGERTGHAHGHRDRVDTPHHAGRHERWTLPLRTDAYGDDEVKAWCECGGWTLSRAQMRAWQQAGNARVVLR
jgi:hypothetical protein